MTAVPGCSVWRLSDAAETWFAVYRKRCREIYGRELNPYESALKAFGDLPFRHPLKHEFLLLTQCHQWPDEFQLERDGIVNDWAVRMAKGFCWAKRLSLMGSGSSGKTATAAAYVYTLWKANAFSCSVFLSTTSGEAAQARTWGQVKDWHAKDRYTIGKRIESLHLITLDEETRDEEGQKIRDYRDSIKVVLIKPGNEGRNVMASIVGRKNDYVVWVADELNFMDVGILDARVNLNTNPFHQFVGLFNAPDEGSPAYIDGEPVGDKFPDGWRSVDKDRDQHWPTKSGLCIYFNGQYSPNYKAAPGKPFPFPKLMNESFRLEILHDAGGEDQAMYWKQFYGFPPSVDVSDKVMSHKLLLSNGAFTLPLWNDTKQIVLAGLDLGFKLGGDPSVISFGKVGKNTDQRTILAAMGDGIALLPKAGDKAPYEVQIARRVIEECRLRNCHDLALDVTGDGGILLQHIEREAREQGYSLNVLAVSFSGSADDTIVIPGEKRTARETFSNKVSQLWSSFRLCVLNKVITGMAERGKAVSQLCSRKAGTDDKKRMTVEKKSEMKKRLRCSPDYGDSAVLLAHLALKHGLSGMDAPKAPPKKPLEERQAKLARYTEHGTGRYAGR